MSTHIPAYSGILRNNQAYLGVIQAYLGIYGDIILISP